MRKTPKDTRERDALAAKMRGKLLMLTGRERKELAMVKARKMAAGGRYAGFSQVVEAMAAQDEDAADTLRIWAVDNDISSIDTLCAKGQSVPSKR